MKMKLSFKPRIGLYTNAGVELNLIDPDVSIGNGKNNC